MTYDTRYYAHLDRVVQKEPWLQRDRAMIDTLRTIGVEKGKPFAPDDTQRQQLDAAAAQAHALLDDQFDRLFDTPFWPGTRWAFVTSQDLAAELTQDFPDPNRRFELMARFYGPEPALFDQSWKLLDVERMT